jgi:hypothetical protein
MESNLIYKTFEVVAVIFGMLIVQQYISGLFERRAKKLYVLLGYTVFSVGLSFLSLFFREPLLMAWFTLTGVFLLSLLFYEGQKTSKFFAALFFGILMICSDMICAVMLSMGGDIDISDILSYGLPRSLGLAISKTVQILLVKVAALIVKWKKDKKSTLELRKFVPILLCQIFSIILLYNIFMTAFDADDIMDIKLFFSILIIMYVNIIIFWYYDKITSAYEYKRQNELTELKLEFQKDYYQLLEEHQQEIESLYHDIKKHVSAVKELHDKDFKTEAEQYVSKLENKIIDIPKVLRTSDSVVNALIMNELRKAKNKNIEVRLDINFSKAINIEPIDLCVLIGNTLDNAIEACLALPNESDRIIDLRILQDGCLILIDIKNPYDPAVIKISQNNRKRGYGLKNVRKVVQKYRGDIEIMNTDNVFHISIIIP